MKIKYLSAPLQIGNLNQQRTPAANEVTRNTAVGTQGFVWSQMTSIRCLMAPLDLLLTLSCQYKRRSLGHSSLGGHQSRPQSCHGLSRQSFSPRISANQFAQSAQSLQIAMRPPPRSSRPSTPTAPRSRPRPRSVPRVRPQSHPPSSPSTNKLALYALGHSALALAALRSAVIERDAYAIARAALHLCSAISLLPAAATVQPRALLLAVFAGGVALVVDAVLRLLAALHQALSHSSAIRATIPTYFPVAALQAVVSVAGIAVSAGAAVPYVMHACVSHAEKHMVHHDQIPLGYLLQALAPRFSRSAIRAFFPDLNISSPPAPTSTVHNAVDHDIGGSTSVAVGISSSALSSVTNEMLQKTGSTPSSEASAATSLLDRPLSTTAQVDLANLLLFQHSASSASARLADLAAASNPAHPLMPPLLDAAVALLCTQILLVPVLHSLGNVLLHATPAVPAPSLRARVNAVHSLESVVQVSSAHFWHETPAVCIGTISVIVARGTKPADVRNRIDRIFETAVHHLTTQVEEIPAPPPLLTPQLSPVFSPRAHKCSGSTVPSRTQGPKQG
jgi:hypothetical protein